MQHTQSLLPLQLPHASTWGTIYFIRFNDLPQLAKRKGAEPTTTTTLWWTCNSNSNNSCSRHVLLLLWLLLFVGYKFSTQLKSRRHKTHSPFFSSARCKTNALEAAIDSCLQTAAPLPPLPLPHCPPFICFPALAISSSLHNWTLTMR